MSPSKPLTERQRMKRKIRRAKIELLTEIATQNPRIRASDGRVGYFLPVLEDPSLTPGSHRLARF